MDKYINEKELLKAIASECDYQVDSCDNCKNKCDLYRIIYYQGDITHCRDCKHGEPGDCGYGVDCDGVWHDDDWFCADGERK